MSERREFWIDPVSGKSDKTPYEPHLPYSTYLCVDLPGGFWPERVIHVTEIKPSETVVDTVKLGRLLDAMRELSTHTVPRDIGDGFMEDFESDAAQIAQAALKEWEGGK